MGLALFESGDTPIVGGTVSDLHYATHGGEIAGRGDGGEVIHEHGLTQAFGTELNHAPPASDDFPPQLYFHAPDEHQPGRTIISSEGNSASGQTPQRSMDDPYSTYDDPVMVDPGSDPPDPVRSSQFQDYTLATGVDGKGTLAHGQPVTHSLTYFVNSYTAHGQRDWYNQNPGNGKPAELVDNRGRVLDGRMQFPGQRRFRFMTNIPRPAYMSFSDLVDQEGVQ
jgi:hypothetical protein